MQRRFLRSACVGLLLFLSAAVPCGVHAAAPSPREPITKSPPDGIVLPYVPRQLVHLRNLSPECYAPFAGTFAQESMTAALVVATDGTATCPALAGPAGPVRVSFKVIPLKPFGINLVRIDQDFGGSTGLRRYVVLSVIGRIVATGANTTSSQLLLVSRGVLQPSIRDDYEAWRMARRWASTLTTHH